MATPRDRAAAGLRLAVDGNRRLGLQLSEPPGRGCHALADQAFTEPGWPDRPGWQPLSLASRLIIAASWSASDLARVLTQIDDGAGILTADLLCRHVLEAAATGTWIIRPGVVPRPDDPATPDAAFQFAAQRERIERAHLTRWLSMTFYDEAQLKDKDRRDRIEGWKSQLAGRVTECPLVEGEQRKYQLDGTVQAGLARMATELEKITFGPPGKRPRIYSRLSAYAHPNVDSIVEMEGPDGHWVRDADDMVHLLYLALSLVSRAWEILAVYAGWDTADVEAWRAELDEINAFGDGPEASAS
jgi:hypothetical protein